MYCLNDKHDKYEYGLYIQVNNGLPYIINFPVTDAYKCISVRIQEIEKKHNRYNQRFYIDNDFYNNKYTLDSGGTYYKFLRRIISDWEEFESFTEGSNLDKSKVVDILKYF